MVRVLVSACLLGREVRYDGTDNEVGADRLAAWQAEDRIVPFCPEVAGGLGTPRPPAEIVGGTGADVLEDDARVVTEGGQNVTDAYLAGARGALEAARAADAELAVLKEGSPSCGSEYVYDGSFSGTRRDGRGVTAALLERHGIPVYDEDTIDRAAQYLQRIEEAARAD